MEVNSSLPVLGGWRVRGLGAWSKALLKHLEVEFEDKMHIIGPAPDYDASDWTSVKHNLGLELANIPYYIDGDVRLTGSVVILRFICSKYKPEYLGRNIKEQARADMIMDTLQPAFFDKFSMPQYSADWESKREAVVAFSREFFAMLATFKGENRFLLGAEPTYPDFYLYEFLLKTQALDTTILS
jgi:glutathione S-transferase